MHQIILYCTPHRSIAQHPMQRSALCRRSLLLERRNNYKPAQCERFLTTLGLARPAIPVVHASGRKVSIALFTIWSLYRDSTVRLFPHCCSGGMFLRCCVCS